MIAAIVLAAGSSTRMAIAGATAGAGGRPYPVPTKALLPLGSTSVLERVVRAVRQAGVDEIVVVTGHAAAEVTAAVRELGARPVHNAAHLTGMFSSVQAGVRALDDDIDAFFVLPVDCALLRPRALAAMIEYRDGDEGAARVATRGAPSPAVLYPICCGRRGHPPLLPGSFRDGLARADAQAAGGLHGFLQRQAVREIEVEVEDLTILMDMDTPDDYVRMTRFAAYLDAPETTGLSDDDSRYLRSLLAPSAGLVRHQEAVAAVGTALAVSLRGHIPGLDSQLVRSACLLHDMAKAARGHAAVARNLLERLGLPRLGEVVGAHMVLPPDKLASETPTEEQLVYLADKLVHEDKLVSLETRARRTLEKHAGDPEVERGVATRMRTAKSIVARVEALAGRSLADILAEPASDDRGAR